ncbi:MAG: hypothetical protein ACLFPM_01410 [Candidatus Izemoplasmatales bacterium]
MQNKLSPKQELKSLHIRIWLSAIISSSIYMGINLLFFKDQTSTQSIFIEGITFFLIWIIIHYIFYSKKMKQLKSEQDVNH